VIPRARSAGRPDGDATRPERPWDGVWPDHVPRSIEYPPEPAWWLLLRNVPRFAERPAIRVLDPETADPGAAITYAELAAQARSLAAGLQRAGVRRGDRVAFSLPNSPALVACYFGAWLAGAVGVPCNPMHRPPELEYQLRDADVALLITARELHPAAAEAASRLDVPIFVAPTGAFAPDPDGVPRGASPWTEVLAPAADLRPVEIDPGRDLALLLYTGGTTGVPKGAALTHRNVVANAVQFATWYGFEEGGETCIATLPMFHSGGMAGAMTVPLYAGATLALFPRFRAAGVARAIGRHRCTRFFGVPTMYAAVLNLPDCRGYDFATLRACRTSAAPLPAAVKGRFDELVGREVLVEGYGLSETSPLALANPVGRAKAGSIGIPLSDTDAAIVDPNGAAVLPGEPGELVLRGPQVMQGYWRRPEETATAFAGGWFHTGDIARLDEDGYFQIVDRLKDVINTAGYKVWPREVEEVLYAHPAVQLAAVVGVPDAYRGEIVKAFVVLRDGAAHGVDAGAVIAYCRERLAAYKVPRAVEFRDALPMSGAGKVLRRVLRDAAVSAESGSVPSG
jgi:long-chain acyl-CoA synthetase